MNNVMTKTPRRRYWLAILVPLAVIILLLASTLAVLAASVVAKTVTAPTSGTFDIQVAFNGPFTSGQQIAYQTVDGTAKAGVDFVGIASDTKNCPHYGNPCPTLFGFVTIIGNATYKPDVSFQICYLNTTNCGTITIQSALPAPSSPPTQQAQSITFNALGGKTYGDAPFNVSASASSNLTVAFSSQTTGVCTVSGTQVTIVGAGGCTIRASQAGNSAYFAAPDVDRSFTVSKANQSITFNPNPLPAKTYGDSPFTVSASASSGLGVSYGASGNCSASGAQITLTDAGSCTVTANQGGNANYNAANAVPRTFSIAKGTASLTLDQTSLGQTYDGTPRAVTATTNPSNLSAVTVTYQGTGDTTYLPSTTPPINAGTYAVTASLSNPNYAATDATATMIVAQATSATTVAVTNATYTASPYAGASATATGAGTLNQALPVTYSGRNSTAYGPSTTPPTNAGDYTASATFAGDTNHTGSQGSGDFTIAKATATLTLMAGDLSRTYDGSPQAVATTSDPPGLTVVAVTYAGTGGTIYPASATPPTGAGTYTVTAQLTNANYTADATDTPTIGKANQSSTFGTPAASPAPTYTYGTDSGFTVGATATSHLPVSFASQTTGVCTISGTAITIVGAGDCTIVASQTGDANHNAATDVPRTFAVAQASSTTTVTAPDAAYTASPYTGASATATGFGGLDQSITPLNYSGRNGTSYGPSTSAPTTVGDYTASATFAGDTNHTGSQGSADFRITRATQTITFLPTPLPDRTFGDAPFTVAATASSGLPVSFAAGPAGVCTASGATVTLVGVGDCTVTASQAGNANYQVRPPVARPFRVTRAATTTTARGDATYGDATATLTATVTRTSDGKPVAAGAAVTFTFGGHTYPATTNAQGVATATAPLPTGQAAGTFAGRVHATYAGATAALPSATSGPLVVARRILWVKPVDQTVKLKQPNPTGCVLELANGSAFAPGDSFASLNLTNLRYTTSRNYPSSNAAETVGKTYKLAASGVSSTNYDLRFQQGTLTVVAP